MLTLWDLVRGVLPKPAPPPRAPKVAPARAPRRVPAAPFPVSIPKPANSMQERYDQITRQMLDQYNVRVRRWRTHMSGIAWEVHYRDGRINRLIEAPKPKGPMSVAIFLHEIGHHAIGFNTFRPRCLEEYHAWAFAIEQMEKLNLNITESVRRRMHNSLRYAIQKASRRGLKQLPPELTPFMVRWPGPPRGRSTRPRATRKAATRP
jgi:hypothetical protein